MNTYYADLVQFIVRWFRRKNELLWYNEYHMTMY